MKIKESSENKNLPEFWISSEDYIMCRCCARYQNNIAVPAALQKMKKNGSTGFISKHREQFNINKSPKSCWIKSSFMVSSKGTNRSKGDND